jgi:hypothetical protein
MYRMRLRPSPLRVTRPPPSSNTRALVFTTLAVAFIRIVTGCGPQEKRMTPPARTAATTAADVQLAAVPWPTTRSGPTPDAVSAELAGGALAARNAARAKLVIPPHASPRTRPG